MADTPKDPTPNPADTPAPVFNSPEAMIKYLEKRYFIIHRSGRAIWAGVLSAAVLIAMGVTMNKVPAMAKDQATVAANQAVNTALDELRVEAKRRVQDAVDKEIKDNFQDNFVIPTQQKLTTHLQPWAQEIAIAEVQNWITTEGQEDAIANLERIVASAESAETRLASVMASVDDSLQAQVAFLSQQILRVVSAGYVHINDRSQSWNIGVPVQVEYSGSGVYTLTPQGQIDAYASPILIATPDQRGSGHAVLVSWRQLPNDQFQFELKARDAQGGIGTTGFTYAIFDKPFAQTKAGGGG